MEFSVGEYMCGVPDSLNITGGKGYSATLDNVSTVESPVSALRWQV